MPRQGEKLHVTASEWVAVGGGKLDIDTRVQKARLPFDCCALSMQPFTQPLMAPDGAVFDASNIIPFVKDNHTHPLTGEPLELRVLVPLKFARNATGQYHCPITFKAFNEHTHIVANRVTGNVYSFDAINELNFKARNMNDLLTGEPFKRSDIIEIQNPANVEARMIDVLKVKENMDKLKKKTGAATSSQDDKAAIRQTGTGARILDELRREEASRKRAAAAAAAEEAAASVGANSESKRVAAAPMVATNVQDRRLAASFTSTTISPMTRSEMVMAERRKLPKRKGYVKTPVTCENFITLCERGYYNDVSFHRLIPNFMIQGGDPTGTGRGGKSMWNREFADEFTQKLSHDARGVLSMANHGPKTNGSQLYGAPKHLDFKHTVFGRVVGGLDTLRVMEAVAVDAADKPLTPIKILSTEVFQNPYNDADVYDTAEDVRKRKVEEERRKKESAEYGAWYSNPSAASTASAGSSSDATVGKYLPSAKPK